MASIYNLLARHKQKFADGTRKNVSEVYLTTRFVQFDKNYINFEFNVMNFHSHTKEYSDDSLIRAPIVRKSR